MNQAFNPKRIFVLVGIVAVLLIVLFSHKEKRETDNTVVLDPIAQCQADLARQQDYLNNEPYSAQYKFQDYWVISTDDAFAPAQLDPNSSRFAQEFKTKLREALSKTPVNFARNYSIVSVGMTGWGNNYWIVNRRTGRAFEFPYHAITLEYDRDSNLLIMNSKASIQKLLAENPEGGCYYINQEKITDLRPFYFKWEDNQLVRLAPSDIDPPVNTFWVDYFSGMPEGTPEGVMHFARAIKTGVVGHLARVPQEGYTGFDIIKAFPGIHPADFTGVSTPYGGFSVTEKGELSFFGNAPSNAASLELKGFTPLLQNIGKRLNLPTETAKDAEAIIKKISA